MQKEVGINTFINKIIKELERVPFLLRTIITKVSKDNVHSLKGYVFYR
jgi:hypothetical protein